MLLYITDILAKLYITLSIFFSLPTKSLGTRLVATMPPSNVYSGWCSILIVKECFVINVFLAFIYEVESIFVLSPLLSGFVCEQDHAPTVNHASSPNWKLPTMPETEPLQGEGSVFYTGKEEMAHQCHRRLSTANCNSHLPPPIPIFLLVQIPSSKQMVSTDNIQPMLDLDYSRHY